jgi:hypothetical protein
MNKETEDEFYDRCAKEAKETDFVEWCEENGEEPTNQEARERYHEIQAETGDAWWDTLSPEDRDGYASMMTAD